MKRIYLLSLLRVYLNKIRNHVKKQNVTILKASNYLEDNHLFFSEIVSKTYNIIAHLEADYPRYFSWY